MATLETEESGCFREVTVMGRQGHNMTIIFFWGGGGVGRVGGGVKHVYWAKFMLTVFHR